MITTSNLVKNSDLFNVRYGNGLELVYLKQCNETADNAIPFVSRTKENNGVSAFVEKDSNIETMPAHSLSVSLGGSVLETFYQPLPYYTAFHVMVLTPKKKMEAVEMLFYAKCISSNSYKYNFGRQGNRTLKDILIPSRLSAKLRKSLLDCYEEQKGKLSTASITNEVIALDVERWAYFKLGDYFDIAGSKTTPLLK